MKLAIREGEENELSVGEAHMHRGVGLKLVQVAINCLATMTSGMTLAFPAVALPAVTGTESEIPSPTQVSLVGAWYYLNILLSSLLAKPFMKLWGRRRILLFALFTNVAGWLLLPVDGSMVMFVVGLTANGAGFGLTSSCSNVYLSEIAIMRRKAVSTLRNASFFLGVTLMYVLGFSLRNDWRKIAFISALVPVLVLVAGVFCLKEPQVLLKRTSEAKKDESLLGGWKLFWSAHMNRPEAYRPFYVLNAIAILREFSGLAVLITHTIIFAEKVEVGTDPHLLSIHLGVSTICGSFFASFLTMRYGRRRTLVYVGTLMSLSLLILAKLHKISGVHADGWPFFTAEGILIAIVGTSTVFLLVSQNVPDLYLPEFRELSTSIYNINGTLASGVAVVTYPVLSTCLNYNNLVMCYATSSVLCVVLVILTIPDEGKQFQAVTVEDKVVKTLEVAERKLSDDVRPLRGDHESIGTTDVDLNTLPSSGIENDRSKMCGDH